jgi:hypothetical protein
MDAAISPPRHFWPVAVLSLLWNLFGGYDYLMTNMRDPGYVAHIPPGAIDALDAIPTWASAAWTIGVWGAVLGSVLLLARSRFAVHAFAASLAGLAASTVYRIETPEAAAPIGLTILIWAGAIGFLGFAIEMRRRRVLR